MSSLHDRQEQQVIYISTSWGSEIASFDESLFLQRLDKVVREQSNRTSQPRGSIAGYLRIFRDDFTSRGQLLFLPLFDSQLVLILTCLF